MVDLLNIFVGHTAVNALGVRPPWVISISYGESESETVLSDALLFNNMAMMLGLMGTTIVVSSGDDGVTNGARGTEQGPEACKYDASYPASSPYVVSVGATQGPESSNEEVACQSDGGGVVTTGGGFSNYYPIPEWQKSAVEGYFASFAEKDTWKTPAPGFNRSGRG